MEFILFFCLLLGGSIGSMGNRVLSDGLLVGSEGIVRIDMDRLSVDVDRANGASSNKF